MKADNGKPKTGNGEVEIMNNNKLRESQITVIKKEPGKASELIPLFENSLSAFQEAVGGNIESVTLFSDFCFICNEDGLALGLPYNCNICGVDFFGTVIGVGVHGDEFTSVPAAHTNSVIKMMDMGKEGGAAVTEEESCGEGEVFVNLREAAELLERVSDDFIGYGDDQYALGIRAAAQLLRDTDKLEKLKIES